MKLSWIHIFSSFCLFIFSMGSGVFSQTFGLNTGMNISSLQFYNEDDSGTYLDDYNAIISLNAGAYYDFKFSERLGMRLGLGYSAKGYRYKSEISSGYTIDNNFYSQYSNIESKGRLDYLQFNPMFKYTLEIGGVNTFYAMVGPYISIGLSGRLTERQIYAYDSPNNTTNIDESYTEIIEFGAHEGGFDYLDFGLTPSIGFQVSKFFLEVSYDLGINNIGTENYNDFKIYNRTIAIKSGYIFGVK